MQVRSRGGPRFASKAAARRRTRAAERPAAALAACACARATGAHGGGAGAGGLPRSRHARHTPSAEARRRPRRLVAAHVAAVSVATRSLRPTLSSTARSCEPPRPAAGSAGRPGRPPSSRASRKAMAGRVVYEGDARLRPAHARDLQRRLERRVRAACGRPLLAHAGREQHGLLPPAKRGVKGAVQRWGSVRACRARIERVRMHA